LDAQGRVLYSSPQFPREMVEISLPVLEFDGSSPPGPAWRDEPEMPPEPPPEPPERDEPRMPTAAVGADEETGFPNREDL